MLENELGKKMPKFIAWNGFTIYTNVFTGATEDAISQAREAFHAHLASAKRGQQQQQQPPDYTDEELLMEERDFDQEFSGNFSFILIVLKKLFMIIIDQNYLNRKQLN